MKIQDTQTGQMYVFFDNISHLYFINYITNKIEVFPLNSKCEAYNLFLEEKELNRIISMDLSRDHIQQRLSQIKQRVAKQNENNDAYQSAQTVSMDFSTFIYKCIQQRLNPSEFFKIISGCYSILKWVLIEKQAKRCKAEISFYTIVVNYIASLKIRVSPYEDSDSYVIFEAVDQEQVQNLKQSNFNFFIMKRCDQAALAKVCLHLFESYLEYYIQNKKEISLMTLDTFYTKMERYRRDNNIIQDVLKKEQKQLTQEDVDLYMQNEEINISIRANEKLRQQAGVAVKKFFISKIKNEDLDIQKLQKTQEQINNDLLEYRERMKQQYQQNDNNKSQKTSNRLQSFLYVGVSIIIYIAIIYLAYIFIIKPFL